MSDININGIPNMGFQGGGGGYFYNPAANLAQNQAAIQNNNQAVSNASAAVGSNANVFDPFKQSGGFGTMTDYYSNLGAAYGRATGGFGGQKINDRQALSNWGGGLFDADAYRRDNPDVAAAGVDPTAHWFDYGQKEGRTAHTFNPYQYQQANPDVWSAGVDPYQHYKQYGITEGRTGAWSDFNPTDYLNLNPDVKAAGVDPTAHWFEYGEKEGRKGSTLSPLNSYQGSGFDAFDPNIYGGSHPTAGFGQQPTADAPQPDWNDLWKERGPFQRGADANTTGRDDIAAAYYANNRDVYDAARGSGQDMIDFAMNHFMNYGQNEGRSIFDANEYLRENPDVAAAGVDPTAHWFQYGQNEGRYAPMSSAFNSATYLAQNPDVAAAGVNPLQHYMEYGQNEGRSGGFGDTDDYWGRGYMASDDPYSYGDPTGVGGSGYGDGFGGYGNAENNPWPAPPGANVADPKSFFVYSDPGTNPWQDTRSPFYNDITSDPARMYDMAVKGYLELKRDPTGRQGVFETMFNQKAARPELNPLRADYFPHDPVKDRLYLQDYANTTATLRNNPELLAKLYGEIGRAYSSNITHGATDWASGTVAANSANRTTETYKSPVEGERFFIKNIPNLYDGIAAGRANAAWLLGIQQQLPDYHWPQ